MVLDLRGLSDVTDYFVICHGTTERQVQAIADAIEERLALRLRRRAASVEGRAPGGVDPARLLRFRRTRVRRNEAPVLPAGATVGRRARRGDPRRFAAARVDEIFDPLSRGEAAPASRGASARRRPVRDARSLRRAHPSPRRAVRDLLGSRRAASGSARRAGGARARGTPDPGATRSPRARDRARSPRRDAVERGAGRPPRALGRSARDVRRRRSARASTPRCSIVADARWSLSPLTLPHELVRVVVAEQLYRAITLLRRLPYHK